MFIWRKYTVIGSVSLSVALLVSGCNETKVAQCERLMKKVNEGSALIDKSKGQQVTTSLQLSKDLEKVTKSIKEMNFKDAEVQKFQTDFVQQFETLSQAIAKAGKALGAAKTAEASATGREKLQKARTEIDRALTDANKAAMESDSLEDEVKNYCNQPE
ncbi:MAG: hypothetical protein ACHBN1_04310 [Heteroscytonema crispum UTEX LB 1556]